VVHFQFFGFIISDCRRDLRGRAGQRLIRSQFRIPIRREGWGVHRTRWPRSHGYIRARGLGRPCLRLTLGLGPGEGLRLRGEAAVRRGAEGGVGRAREGSHQSTFDGRPILHRLSIPLSLFAGVGWDARRSWRSLDTHADERRFCGIRAGRGAAHIRWRVEHLPQSHSLHLLEELCHFVCWDSDRGLSDTLRRARCSYRCLDRCGSVSQMSTNIREGKLRGRWSCRYPWKDKG
jgi:hypothetical protein